MDAVDDIIRISFRECNQLRHDNVALWFDRGADHSPVCERSGADHPAINRSEIHVARIPYDASQRAIKVLARTFENLKEDTVANDERARNIVSPVISI